MAISANVDSPPARHGRLSEHAVFSSREIAYAGSVWPPQDFSTEHHGDTRRMHGVHRDDMSCHCRQVRTNTATDAWLVPARLMIDTPCRPFPVMALPRSSRGRATTMEGRSQSLSALVLLLRGSPCAPC